MRILDTRSGLSPFESEPLEKPEIHAYACRPNGVHAISRDEAISLFHAPDTPGTSRPMLWIDVLNPGDEEASFLRDQLKLHPLAVEDCMRGRQRPKLERYSGYFFLVAYAARVNPDRNRVAFNELHAFFGTHFIVTVHDQKINELKETLVRWRTSHSHFQDVAAIAHALLDSIVDSYFEIIDHFADHVSRAEGEMLDSPENASPENVLVIRRELIIFRRVVGPIRDVIGRLVRRELPFVSPALVPYFQDVRDHAIRITEEIDTLRDLIASILESQTSASSHQLNQTMRVMAAWSIILMSITVVAGIYGMNFHFMPELGWRYGYPGALGVMLLVGSGLFYLFRRRHWV
jgi:magnesium transporter